MTPAKRLRKKTVFLQPFLDEEHEKHTGFRKKAVVQKQTDLIYYD